MATARFDNLDEDKQDQIIDAAVEEFADKGYEAASINRIIEQAGISKGSMYYYFEDKADLFDTALRRATERLLEMAGGFDIHELDANNFWSYLEAYTERSLTVLREHQTYIQFARGFHHVMQPGDDGPASETMEWGRQFTRQLLEHGQNLGVIRTDLPMDLLVQLSLSVDMVFDRWMLENWEDFEAGEVEQLLSKQIAIIERIFSSQ